MRDRSFFLVPLVLLTACKSCQPSLPSDGDDDTRIDTSQHSDDSEVETADTGPVLPVRCDNMEVEPNNTLDEIQPITMESWWCGNFSGDGALGDTEFISFTTLQPGWLSVHVEASARGTEADAQFLLYDEDNHSVFVYGSLYEGQASSDPRLVVPGGDAQQWGVVVAETGYNTGDDYGWALLASTVKPPVEWTFTEAEDNDSEERAQSFEVGEVIFGKMDVIADRDWYRISVPEGLSAVQFTVEAFGSGSPSDLMLTLYESGIRKRYCYQGVLDYDLDPTCEQKVTTATEWTLLVEDEYDLGSDFNWYTLTITGVVE